MITFKGKKYELFFSNDLLPFWAFHYSDADFFSEFKKLCGGNYKILSIIQNKWQKKYAEIKSIKKLSNILKKRTKNHKWVNRLKKIYSRKIHIVEKLLETRIDGKTSVIQIFKILKHIRKESAVLDAMSNMLHMAGNLLEKELDKDVSRFAIIVKHGVSKNFAVRRRYINKVFKLLAAQNSLALEDFEFLTFEEIGTMLLSGKARLNKTIKERKEMVVIFFDNKFKIVSGRRASNFIEQGKFKEIEEIPLEYIKGTPAWPGIVVGHAVVSNNLFEAKEKMKEGRVLIVPYTGPEYLPLMKIAKAIITDTGGITSHAAIVARELKIPCITGAKMATKFLKDGDKVEVDAEKGIVRKI